MAGSMDVKRITWPHEVISIWGQESQIIYKELSIPLVQGYLIVMRCEMEAVRAKMASHLEDLMGDLELYVWERVRAYHGVWLNQLEQGRATWEDEEDKVRFRMPLSGTRPPPLHQQSPLQQRQVPRSSQSRPLSTMYQPGPSQKSARPTVRASVPMEQPTPTSMCVPIAWPRSVGLSHTRRKPAIGRNLEPRKCLQGGASARRVPPLSVTWIQCP